MQFLQICGTDDLSFTGDSVIDQRFGVLSNYFGFVFFAACIWRLKGENFLARSYAFTTHDVNCIRARNGHGSGPSADRVGSGHGSDLHFTVHFCALFSIIRMLTVVT